MEYTSSVSILILAVFFIIYLAIYRFGRERGRALDVYLAVASLLMYAIWYPPAVIILLLYILLVKYAGALLWRTRSKALLTAVVSFLVAVLAFFKYIHYLPGLTGIGGDWTKSIFVPLGISFYTLSFIGYFVDVYRGRLEPPDSMLECVIFVSFWPTICSGPILRTKSFFPALRNRVPLSRESVALSFVLIASGMVKKLLIADNLGSYVNWNLGFGVERMDFHEAWITIIGFIGQIYGDFSGYSDIAIGMALLLGVRLPANFNYPYVSSTLTELWRRWHISLSYWLRDYVYIPLGGSKKGSVRHYLNIMITFVVSGIWHGTGLGYIIWGAINGAVICLERIFHRKYERIPARLRTVFTFLAFTIGGVFFRLDIKNALVMIQKMCGYQSLHFRTTTAIYVLPIIFLMLYVFIDHRIQFYKVDADGYPSVNNKRYAIVALCILLALALIFAGQEQPFFYFQF